MEGNSRCEHCSAPLTGQEVAGLCANCLLKLALEPPAESAAMADGGATTPFGHFGDQPDRTDLPGEQPGDTVDRFKLLQLIGEGGFGSVWMAEQNEPVQRRVALKIIRMGMDTREFVARFEQERQALAMMDHPSIARVLDGGATPAGRPYFVMELVRGVPITKFCDEHQLPLATRLELFIEVCHAIQHAHQKGIIHRDIKPSNVMVALDGDRAVPKVIDFGIAKATQGKLTDRTLFTRFEQVIGTPVYMSPEQAGLGSYDIDTRCDIYALGVLLYELLTGKPPFDAKSLASVGYQEMWRIIREVEPPKPSSRLNTIGEKERTTLANARRLEPGKLSRMVEPDLDWIVMKAIEKDRARRYETVNGLALDVRRFLADEPVSATPPSAAYKFRKFAHRNKAALSTGAGIAAALIAATIVSSWQAVRATNAERLANDRLVEKDKALKDAEAISAFLGEVFQSPDPERKGRGITVAETLDRAAKKLDTDLASQPDHKAKLQAALGRTYNTLGLHSEAITLQEKVWDFYRATRGPEDPDTLAAMHALAGSYHDADRREEGLKLAEEVLTLRKKVNGPEHSDTLAAMHNLATSYHYTSRREEGLKMREDVLTLRRKVNGLQHPDTLGAMHNLARSYRDAGRPDEAFKLRDELLPLSRKVNGPEHPATLMAMTNLANSYNEASRHEEALKLEEEVLPLCRKVLGPEHRHTLDASYNLAKTYFRVGRKNEALKLQGEMLPLYCNVIGLEHPHTLEVMNDLTISYSAAGRMDEAITLGEELMTLRRKVLGPEHTETIGTMLNLASYYKDASRQAEAIKLGEEVLALSRKVNGPERRATMGIMDNLARTYHDAGRPADSLKLGEETLRLYRKVFGTEHAETIGPMLNLVLYYQNAGRLDDSIKLGEEVVALSRKFNGLEHRHTIAAMNDLANSYEEAGRLDDALKLKEDVLTLSRKVLGPEHPRTFIAMFNLSISYDNADRKDEALTLREQVFAGRSKMLGPEDRLTLKAMSGLASSYHDAGRRDEALKLRAEVLPLCRKVLGNEHRDTLTAIHDLAVSCNAAGRTDEALKLVEELLPLRRKVSGPEHPDTLAAMRNLAATYADASRGKDALQLTEELLTLSQKVNGPEHRETLNAMTNLAVSYAQAGRKVAALKLRENVLALSRKVNSEEHPDTLLAISNLAVSYSESGRLNEAIKLQKQSLEVVRRVLPQDARYRAVALQNMAKLYEQAGRKKEAAAIRRELADTGKPGPPAPTAETKATPEPNPAPDNPAVLATLVAPNAEWKWLHPTDGNDPAVTVPGFHTSFFRPDFDDSAWQTGKDSDGPTGGFGYGLTFTGVSIGKPDDVKQRKTAYFRHRFTTPKMHANLEFRCQRDDGIIVYLDGKEVIRDNVAPGADGWLLPSLEAMDRDNDGVVHRHAISGTLAPGSHILAISVHNTAQPSTDLRLGGVTLVEVTSAAAEK